MAHCVRAWKISDLFLLCFKSILGTDMVPKLGTMAVPSMPTLETQLHVSPRLRCCDRNKAQNLFARCNNVIAPCLVRNLSFMLLPTEPLTKLSQFWPLLFPPDHTKCYLTVKVVSNFPFTCLGEVKNGKLVFFRETDNKYLFRVNVHSFHFD